MRQSAFCVHVMRRQPLENTVMAGMISGNRGRGRQRNYYTCSKTVTWSNIINGRIFPENNTYKYGEI